MVRFSYSFLKRDQNGAHNLETKLDILPGGLALRRPTMDDLAVVLELVIKLDIAEYGEPDSTAESLYTYWQHLSLATDAWIISAADSQVIGYASVWRHEPTQLHTILRVLPVYYGRGIRTYLYHLAEKRAYEYKEDLSPATPLVMSKDINDIDILGQQFFEQYDYELVTHSGRSRMQITLKQAPKAGSWPEGINVRLLQPEENSTAFAAVLQEIQTQGKEEFKAWNYNEIQLPTFDPALCFLAWDQDKIVGVIAYTYWLGKGCVTVLNVDPRWRQRGLGLALLLHVFGVLYQKGIDKVIMNVKDQNLNVRHLCEHAGMRAIHHGFTYQKVLR